MTSSVIFSSFDLATCEALKRVAPEIPVGWLLWLEDLSQALPLARERGFNAVNPPFRRVDREGVELARSLSLEVNVWTVNAPADILAMAALGVDRIISDEPALALSLLDSPRFSSGA
jgi:glycerophosphoryl diester phosphodiesterase